MLINDIKTGMQAKIAYKGEAAKTAGPYTTRVETVENNRYVIVHEPLDKGKRIRFVGHNIYELSFMVGSAQLKFDGRYMATVKIDNFFMLRFELIGSGEKVQRRNSYRFVCSIPFVFNTIAENGSQSECIDGIIHDLSGGGIKMVCKEDLPENSLLRMDIILGEEKLMSFGQVRMKRQSPENVRYPFTYGISFELMPEKEEELIVRYIYNEQRKLLSRPQRSLYKLRGK